MPRLIKVKEENAQRRDSQPSRSRSSETNVTQKNAASGRNHQAATPASPSQVGTFVSGAQPARTPTASMAAMPTSAASIKTRANTMFPCAAA